VRGDLRGGGVDVVGALAAVDVVERVEVRVVALGVAHDLQGAVGDHLVGVHVGRGAGAALDDVHHELVAETAGPDLLARRDDRGRLLRFQEPEVAVGEGRGLLHGRKCHHQFAQVRDPHAADREVLHGPDGVDAVVGADGDLALAEQVVLGPALLGHAGGCVSHARNLRRGSGAPVANPRTRPTSG